MDYKKPEVGIEDHTFFNCLPDPESTTLEQFRYLECQGCKHYENCNFLQNPKWLEYYYKHPICSFCTQELYAEYVYVVWRLIESGFLPKDFMLLCCKCI